VQAIQWHDGYQSPNQHWDFERVGTAYVLRVRHSHLVLGVLRGEKEEGAAAVQWDYVQDVPDQLWSLRRVDP
jgi:hypothetical protein